jgi:hypothetical protein
MDGSRRSTVADVLAASHTRDASCFAAMEGWKASPKRSKRST